MRVVIWVDMEGIAGIENWDQVTSGKPQYEEGRRLLTGEVNAAVRGAKAGGADDIIVIDCHGGPRAAWFALGWIPWHASSPDAPDDRAAGRR